MDFVRRVTDKFYRARLGLRRPTTRARIVEFELRSGISLPLDYVDFVTRVGNGASSPFCPLNAIEGWAGCYWIDDPKLEVALKFPCAVTPDAERHGVRWLDECGVEGWEARFDSGAWDPMFGTIAVAEIGCGLHYSLVVNGPHLGRIFAYGDRTDSPPLFCAQASFSEWMEARVDRYLAGDSDAFRDRSR